MNGGGMETEVGVFSELAENVNARGKAAFLFQCSSSVWDPSSNYGRLI